MTNLTQYEKGYSPSAIQHKYGLTYAQGYELAERLKKTQELELENTKLKEQLAHVTRTQAKQFRDNQKLQVKAEHAKDVVNIDTARQIKQLKERVYEFAEANQSLRKKLDEEKAKNRIDYYEGSPMGFLDECARDRKKNKIYKNWINNIREELIISDLRRTKEGNKFVVNFLKKINQVLGEE